MHREYSPWRVLRHTSSETHRFLGGERHGFADAAAPAAIRETAGRSQGDAHRVSRAATARRSLCGSSFAARALGSRRRHRNGHARSRGTGCSPFRRDVLAALDPAARPAGSGRAPVGARPGAQGLRLGTLFTRAERPTTLALAAGNGGAALVGVLLPGRFDDAMRIAVVRRYPGCRAGVRVLLLSLVMLGLIDSVALAPLALAGAALPNVGAGVRAGLAVVAAGGIAAAVVIALLPAPGCEPMATALSARPLGEPAHHVAAARVGGLGARVRLLARARGRVLSPSRRVRRRVFVDVDTSVPLYRGGCGSASGRACRYGHAGRRGWRGPRRSGVGASQALHVAVSIGVLGVITGTAVLVAAIVWRSALSLLASRATAAGVPQATPASG